MALYSLCLPAGNKVWCVSMYVKYHQTIFQFHLTYSFTFPKKKLKFLVYKAIYSQFYSSRYIIYILWVVTFLASSKRAPNPYNDTDTHVFLTFLFISSWIQNNTKAKHIVNLHLVNSSDFKLYYLKRGSNILRSSCHELIIKLNLEDSQSR